ncbi:hypothetical protein FB45DRAFT_538441 [Roridomyces roridus]|uniref:Transmembrane protein n=1 Tax=Roridomyces roridus TaxID=1738132 RepID=A0AAD7FL00_9AGAR|nr:hypothetical protein FB45DRAFT_538441 [Roridomyces roridus]
MPPFHFFRGLFFWINAAKAVLVNVTVDGTAGDPGAFVVYTPPDAWNNGPDSLDGTSHESTFSTNDTHPSVPPTASVSFYGSAVYVFCTLSRSSDADMTFYIDSVPTSTFNSRGIGSTGYDYGVPVYSNTTLAMGMHNLTLQNGHVNGDQSLLILDSIVYTYDDGRQVDAPESGITSTAAVMNSRRTTLAVVAALVAAFVLILIGLAVFLYRRRRHRREIYARYMPNGSISAFPTFLTPNVMAPSRVYAGTTHRPYADPDPSQTSIQRPQRWEHVAAVR